jgi:hypothetical protein
MTSYLKMASVQEKTMETPTIILNHPVCSYYVIAKNISVLQITNRLES